MSKTPSMYSAEPAHPAPISLTWSAGLPDLQSRLDKSLAFSTYQAGKLFIVEHATIIDIGSSDVIDLSGIDADGDTNRDDGFIFGGTSSTMHGVSYQKTGSRAIVIGDMEDDRQADFDIKIKTLAACPLINSCFEQNGPHACRITRPMAGSAI